MPSRATSVSDRKGPPVLQRVEQEITYAGRVVGIVVSTAGADGRLTEHNFVRLDFHDDVIAVVDHMAVYAVLIHRGAVPGPYSDDEALMYAELMLGDAQDEG